MSVHRSIITGASRGLGLAMAQQLLRQNHRLLCISRSTSDAVAEVAGQADGVLTQWQADLLDATPIAQRLKQWLTAQAADDIVQVTLINNAGVIAIIAPLHASDATELPRTLGIGLEASMLISAAFLHATQGWAAERKVLNISSGLGGSPMASQAA